VGRFGELSPAANACSDVVEVVSIMHVEFRRKVVNDLICSQVRAALVSGLYPNVCKVVFPQTKYEETAHGAVPVVSLLC
jgi:hypothetical protein